MPEHASGGVKLTVVGEAPGKTEVNQGRPFVGPSGKMLERGLATIGLKRSDVQWTNAVLCDCRENQLEEARSCCEQRLHDELAPMKSAASRALSGAPVMTVGALALRSVLRKPQAQILKYRGSVIQEGGRTVLPTIHPAFVMREPAWGVVLERDVARVGRFMLGGKPVPPVQFEVIRGLHGLGMTLGAMGRVVSFDVETLELGPTETPLICYALSDGERTAVVPWSTGRDGTGSFWGAHEKVASEVTSICFRNRKVIMQNGEAFDAIVAKRYGIEIAEWGDTLLAYHVLESHLPKNLAHIATQFLDLRPWKMSEERHASLEALYEYNATDAWVTIKLWYELEKRLSNA